MAMQLPTLVPTPARVAALDRLGDEIAELSAHLHPLAQKPTSLDHSGVGR